MRQTLGKEEKLKSKIAIEQLFTDGNRIKSFPLQLIYLQNDHNSKFPIKVAFTVPKRSVKLAVDRNRIKRLMREVYRKNKHLFIEEINDSYFFMFIYMDKEETKQENLELSITKIHNKFSAKTKENEQN